MWLVDREHAGADAVHLEPRVAHAHALERLVLGRGSALRTTPAFRGAMHLSSGERQDDPGAGPKARAAARSSCISSTVMVFAHESTRTIAGEARCRNCAGRDRMGLARLAPLAEYYGRVHAFVALSSLQGPGHGRSFRRACGTRSWHPGSRPAIIRSRLPGACRRLRGRHPAPPWIRIRRPRRREAWRDGACVTDAESVHPPEVGAPWRAWYEMAGRATDPRDHVPRLRARDRGRESRTPWPQHCRLRSTSRTCTSSARRARCPSGRGIGCRTIHTSPRCTSRRTTAAAIVTAAPQRQLRPGVGSRGGSPPAIPWCTNAICIDCVTASAACSSICSRAAMDRSLGGCPQRCAASLRAAREGAVREQSRRGARSCSRSPSTGTTAPTTRFTRPFSARRAKHPVWPPSAATRTRKMESSSLRRWLTGRGVQTVPGLGGAPSRTSTAQMATRSFLAFELFWPRGVESGHGGVRSVRTVRDRAPGRRPSQPDRARDRGRARARRNAVLGMLPDPGEPWADARSRRAVPGGLPRAQRRWSAYRAVRSAARDTPR